MQHDTERTLAADRDHGVEAMRPERIEQLLRAVALVPGAVRPLDAPFERIAAIRCSEDRTAKVGDAADFLGPRGISSDSPSKLPNPRLIPTHSSRDALRSAQRRG